MDEASLEGVDLTLSATGMPRRPADSELFSYLRRHADWINSSGQFGKRAVLSGFDLSYRELAGANLAAARLDYALLSDANLQGALLAACDLRCANLIRADLTGADIRGADLTSANLRDAKLIGVRQGELPGTGLSTRRD